MEEKVVFVTGATGYIGKRLCAELLAQGYRVKALCRQLPTTAPMPNLEWVVGDLTNETDLKTLVAGCSQGFHLAAYAKVWAKDPATFFRINVEGTTYLLEAALQAGVKRVVLTSTAGVLGASPDATTLCDENQTPIFPLTTAYEKTKAIAEHKAKAFLQKGMDIITVNPTRVYGPGLLSDSNAVTKILKQYGAGKWKFMPGNGQSIGNYVFVEDVVQGLLLALWHGKSGERYILGGENASYCTLFDTMGQVTGKTLKLYPMPLSVMMAVAKFQKLMADGFGWPPLITPGFVRKYNHHWNVSSQKAIEQLGYSITPLAKGLQTTWQWLQSS
ncbi:MAG TPA: hypothetical protein DCM08_10030 [Microscillaceae bacterium]|nr:hypothetical protein [Microscillaceae bacterium]